MLGEELNEVNSTSDGLCDLSETRHRSVSRVRYQWFSQRGYRCMGTINIHKNIVARLSKEAFERIEKRVADYCGEEASY